MNDEHEHERRERAERSAFKIVDRRRFTASGDVRADAPADAGPKAASPLVKAPEPVEAAAPPPARAAAGAEHAETSSQPPARPSASSVDFLSFISSLATNAMAAMGLLPPSQSRGMPQNLNMAHEYIEIIVMLQERTAGNLSPEEEHAMTQLVADLKEPYFALQRKAQAQAQAPQA